MIQSWERLRFHLVIFIKHWLIFIILFFRVFFKVDHCLFSIKSNIHPKMPWQKFPALSVTVHLNSLLIPSDNNYANMLCVWAPLIRQQLLTADHQSAAAHPASISARCRALRSHMFYSNVFSGSICCFFPDGTFFGWLQPLNLGLRKLGFPLCSGCRSPIIYRKMRLSSCGWEKKTTQSLLYVVDVVWVAKINVYRLAFARLGCFSLHTKAYLRRVWAGSLPATPNGTLELSWIKLNCSQTPERTRPQWSSGRNVGHSVHVCPKHEWVNDGLFIEGVQEHHRFCFSGCLLLHQEMTHFWKTEHLVPLTVQDSASRQNSIKTFSFQFIVRPQIATCPNVIKANVTGAMTD